jgi:hypothetical protein
MLAVALALKLICEIALLALLGQWLVGWMAGAGKAVNPIYRLLLLLGKPWVLAARGLSPRQVPDRHIPWLATLLLVVIWSGAAVAKLSICVRIGLAHCR